MNIDRKVTVADDDESTEYEIEVINDAAAYDAAVSISSTEDDKFAKTLDSVSDLKGVRPGLKRSATMQLKKNHGRATAKSKSIDKDTVYGLFDVAVPPYNLRNLGKLYDKSAFHHAAVDAKVANIVGLGHAWHESDKLKQQIEFTDKSNANELREKVVADKRALSTWLESLNHDDTFQETLERMWQDFETMGNGYLEIGRDNRGRIGYIGHVPAHTIRIRKGRDGFVQIADNRVVFFRNFGDTHTSDPINKDQSPNELMHFKNYSPESTYYGVPDIISALAAVAGNEFAAKFNIEYFENKAVPRYMIIVKGAKLSKQAEENLKSFFRNMKGSSHRSVYVPLPEAFNGGNAEIEIKPIENKVQDASFIKYYQKNMLEIFAAHRISPLKAGIVESVSLGVAREADRQFKESVARPRQAVIEKKLKKIFDEVTKLYVLKLNEFTLTDEETQSRIDERDVRSGVKLRNEVRQRQGLGPIEGGDIMVEAFSKKELTSQARRGRQREQDRDAHAPDNPSSPNSRGEQGGGDVTQ